MNLRLLVPLVAAAALVPTVALLAGPAGATAPSSLGVFFASSSASPVGLVTRVPAESVGGLVFSSSSVRLGKSQAEAAGVTLGPLGDTFVVTSVPSGLLTSVPTVVTAQDPPSTDAPHDAAFAAGQEIGPVKGAVLTAHASDSPSALGEATGAAMDALVIHSGAARSRSESGVRSDGTVFSRAEGRVQDITIGPAGIPALRIATLVSEASVTIPPGGKPVTTLLVQMSGVRIAGVPVTITDEGVRVADSLVLPPSAVSSVNTALAQLGTYGLAITAVPTVRTGDGHSATVSGAALQLRYHLPDAIPRPTDIGADETFQLGNVSASAAARPRVALSLGGPLPSDASGPLTTQPSVMAAPRGAPGPSTVGAPAPITANTASPGFLFPVRASSTLSDQVLASYRMFLLAALMGVGGLITAVRLTRNA